MSIFDTDDEDDFASKELFRGVQDADDDDDDFGDDKFTLFDDDIDEGLDLFGDDVDDDKKDGE